MIPMFSAQRRCKGPWSLPQPGSLLTRDLETWPPFPFCGTLVPRPTLSRLTVSPLTYQTPVQAPPPPGGLLALLEPRWPSPLLASPIQSPNDSLRIFPGASGPNNGTPRPFPLPQLPDHPKASGFASLGLRFLTCGWPYRSRGSVDVIIP